MASACSTCPTRSVWDGTCLPSALFSHSCSSRSVLQRAASCDAGTASGFVALGASLGLALTLALAPALAAGAAAGAARGGGASMVFSVRQPGMGLSLYCVLPRASTHLNIWACAGSASASSAVAIRILMGILLVL